jgi:hypothetical protein
MAGGDLSFVGAGTGGVRNAGRIEAGGDAVLIGALASNSGTIRAGGTAGLATGETVVLREATGDARISVAGASGDVTNSGGVEALSAELRAAGGNVYALAGTSGLIRATGTETRGGRIWLSNTLNNNTDVTLLTTAANTGSAPAGQVTSNRDGDIFIEGAINWSTSARLTINAYRNIVISQSITGASGTLDLRIGQAGFANPAGSGSTATQTAAITARTLLLNGSGAFNLTGANQIEQLGASSVRNLDLRVADATRVYGDANPTFALTVTGFVAPRAGAPVDTAAVLSRAPVAATEATAATGVGRYAITATGANAANYVFAYQPGTLQITPAALTVTATAATRVYGTADPALAFTTAGLKNADTAATVLTGSVAFRAYTTSLVQPLSRRDTLIAFASYQQAAPSLGADLGQVGKNTQLTARWARTLSTNPRHRTVLTLGYDFKQTNNNLLFGGTSISSQKTDIHQASLDLSLTRPWSAGVFGLSATVTASPGGIGGRNSTDAFRPTATRAGTPFASADYVYLRTTLSQTTPLGKTGLEARTRLTGQLASANLLPSEQLSAAGPGVLRGYDPNAAIGTRGFVVSQEIWSPAMSITARGGPFDDRLQVGAFVEAGQVGNPDRLVAEARWTKTAAAGLSAAWSLGPYASLRADYGWQLRALPGTDKGSLGYVTATIGF